MFFLWNFGLEIGNVHIGKQFDLKTPQSAEFEKSTFAEKYYSSQDEKVLTKIEGSTDFEELKSLIEKHRKK